MSGPSARIGPPTPIVPSREARVEAFRFLVLGEFRVEPRGGGKPVRLPASAATVLAYLLCAGRSVPWGVAAGTLWSGLPDAQARRCLSTALWRLRTALGDDGGECIVHRGGEVGIDLGAHRLDLAEFLDLTDASVREPFHALSFDDAARAERGTRLYRGDLLAGWDAPWIDLPRENARRRYHQVLETLARFHAYYGMYERALEAALRLLDEDPLREDVHRHVMRIHLEAGHRTLALRQFERCREALRSELGAEPEEETRRLAADARSSPPSPGPREREGGRLEDAVERLERCIDRLERLLSRR